MKRLLLLLALILLFHSESTYCQSVTQIIDLDTSNFPTIQFAVQFPNRNTVKRYVNQSNTVVEEDGIPQNFDISCPIDQISFAIVLDKSLSMAFKPNDPSPRPRPDPDSVRWRSAKGAIKTFTNNLTPPDSACLISYARYATLEQGFTHEGDLFARAVEAIELDSYTGTWLACDMAIDLLKDRPGRRVMILLNDGDENVYQDHGGPSYLAIRAQAQANNIIVHSIGLGEFNGTERIEQLAQATGGKYYLSADGSDLTDIYNDIIESITSSPCWVRYTADEYCPDGSQRNIHISSSVDGDIFQADTAYYSPFNLETTTITTQNPEIVYPNQVFPVQMEFESYLRPDEPTYFTASFKFDNEAVDFLRLEADSSIFIETPPVTRVSNEGVLEINGRTSTYTPQNKYLFTLYFKAKEIKTATIVSFSWLNIDIVRECNTVSDASIFTFAVDGLCDKIVRRRPSAALSAVYPNPAKSIVNIEVTSHELDGNMANLYITTPNGDVVDMILNAPLKSSETIQYNARQLPSGIYFINLEAGAISHSAKLIVAH